MEITEVSDYFDNHFKRHKTNRMVLAQQQLARLPMELGKTALVMGCGSGLIGVHLARQGVKVMGLDISKKAVEYAKEYNSNKNISYLVADATEFEVGRRFDFIVLPGILDHVLPNRLNHLIANVNKHANKDTVVYANFLVSQFGEYRRDRMKVPPENCTDLGLILKMFDAAGFIPATLETTGNSPIEYYEILFVTKDQARTIWETVYQPSQELPVEGNVPDGTLEGEQ